MVIFVVEALSQQHCIGMALSSRLYQEDHHLRTQSWGLDVGIEASLPITLEDHEWARYQNLVRPSGLKVSATA